MATLYIPIHTNLTKLPELLWMKSANTGIFSNPEASGIVLHEIYPTRAALLPDDVRLTVVFKKETNALPGSAPSLIEFF